MGFRFLFGLVWFGWVVGAAADEFLISATDLRDVYVNPGSGSDSNDGSSAGEALRSVTAAWNRIPAVAGSRGVRVLLAAGEYPESSLPNYWENKQGSASAPIIFESASGPGQAVFRGDVNMFNSSHVYFIGVNIIPDPAGDAFHCEKCSFILLRNMRLSGGARAAHETVKINQSDHIYIEGCDISGADDNAIDFVAVQYGHILRSRVHDAGDWCAYAKGGSASIRVEGNRFFNCGTGGFTAGQGTGFEFMESPWLHYEAYDIQIVNNVIHDTEGAGLGVNGGYNILLAHNTLYRVGSRSHAVEFVFGERSCDGDAARCSARRALGGWGPAAPGTVLFIPNRNVFFLNNLVVNPAPFQSAWQHIAVYTPRTNPGSVPEIARTDTNLRILGNVFVNGDSNLALGVGDSGACDDSNPTCNENIIRASNRINDLDPVFQNATERDLRVLSELPSPVTLTAFPGGDRESSPLAPEGNLVNAVLRDRNGNLRNEENNLPGAYVRNSEGGNDGDSSADAPPVPQFSNARVSKRIFSSRGGRLVVSGRFSNGSAGEISIAGVGRKRISQGDVRVSFSIPRNRSRRNKLYTVVFSAGTVRTVLARVTVRRS